MYINNPGEFKDEENARQLISFSGLSFKTMTPTDIDGILDYKNKLWIIFELKYGNGDLPFGQELALERLCDDLHKTKPAIVIVATHSADVSQKVIAADCIVSKYRYKGKWHELNSIKLKYFMDNFIKIYIR